MTDRGIGFPSVPEEYSKDIGDVEKKFISEADNLSIWAISSEESPVVAYTRGSNGVQAWMGRSVITYNPRCIWRAIIESKLEYDPNVEAYEVVQKINQQTLVVYTR